eukprot:scaffold11885_cov129-Isochrysis_galbana.AAC.9
MGAFRGSNSLVFEPLFAPNLHALSHSPAHSRLKRNDRAPLGMKQDRERRSQLGSGGRARARTVGYVIGRAPASDHGRALEQDTL